MEPVDVLRQALLAVEGAGIPDDLRPLAFTTAVDLVVTGRSAPAGGRTAPAGRPAAAGTAPRPADGAPRADGAPGAPDLPRAVDPDRPGEGPPVAVRGGRGDPVPLRGREDPSGGGGDGWERIAAELGVRRELLDRIWDEHAGRLRLTGDVARLGRTRAERVGNAAVLLLAALRWSGRDEGAPVPDAVVRAEVERLGLLDTGNYTKHLAARRALVATTGSGRTATYKLRYDGAEEAKRLARAVLEDS